MRQPIRTLWRPADIHRQALPVGESWPSLGEVLGEAGLMLAAHLAAALVVVLILRWCAIA
jgi:hypothetical protein